MTAMKIKSIEWDGDCESDVIVGTCNHLTYTIHLEEGAWGYRGPDRPLGLCISNGNGEMFDSAEDAMMGAEEHHQKNVPLLSEPSN